MQWFLAPLIIVVLFAVDGQGAQQAMSVARWAGASINHGVDDLLRPVRKIAGASSRSVARGGPAGAPLASAAGSDPPGAENES
jgi:hypothetical protein